MKTHLRVKEKFLKNHCEKRCTMRAFQLFLVKKQLIIKDTKDQVLKLGEISVCSLMNDFLKK